MSLLQEIQAAQAQVLTDFGDTIYRDIRNIELRLHDLRMENSKMLERLTHASPLSDTDVDLTIIGCRWLESFSLTHIIGLKARIDSLAAELDRHEQVQHATIPDSLREKKTCLLKKNQELKETKQSLLDELTQIKEEVAREKEILKRSVK